MQQSLYILLPLMTAASYIQASEGVATKDSQRYGIEDIREQFGSPQAGMSNILYVQDKHPMGAPPPKPQSVDGLKEYRFNWFLARTLTPERADEAGATEHDYLKVEEGGPWGALVQLNRIKAQLKENRAQRSSPPCKSPQ